MTIDSEAVRDAVHAFDAENALAEDTIEKLFRQSPKNACLRDIYLKVVSLNTLYSTQISLYSVTTPTMEDLARQIHDRHRELDFADRSGERWGR